MESAEGKLEREALNVQTTYTTHVQHLPPQAASLGKEPGGSN